MYQGKCSVSSLSDVCLVGKQEESKKETQTLERVLLHLGPLLLGCKNTHAGSKNLNGSLSAG